MGEETLNEEYLESNEDEIESTATDESDESLSETVDESESEYESESESESESELELIDAVNDIRDALVPVKVEYVNIEAEPIRAVQYADLSNLQVYKLSNGYYAVFDNDVDIYLNNGYLVNASGSTVTGYYVPDPENVNVRDNQKTISVYAPNSTNILRYGSNMYVTTYSRSGTSYTSTNEYVTFTAENVSKAFHQWTTLDFIMIGIIFFILIGVLWRNLRQV